MLYALASCVQPNECWNCHPLRWLASASFALLDNQKAGSLSGDLLWQVPTLLSLTASLTVPVHFLAYIMYHPSYMT
jgi:hypothetical protein